MSVDYEDREQVERFADSVDAALARASPGNAAWTGILLAVWALAGGVLTLAVRTDSPILYTIGLIVVIVWVAWMFRSRPALR
jgi:hypothetical protein